MFMRMLGDGGPQVSAMGVGTWAIGGPFSRGDSPVGWGDVDDRESLRALHRAMDLGVTFFDTSDVYGCGHSERLLGQAIADRRDRVVVATKFGNVFDEASRTITGHDASPEYILRACEASLRRLGTDTIDVYFLHVGDHPMEDAPSVRDALEDLVTQGKIRAYGWSTDDPARARLFAEGAHCVAVEHRMNLFERNDAMLAVCDAFGIASIVRSPLAMGLLTGKFSKRSRLPENDVRHGWDVNGEFGSRLQRLDALRTVLTSDGRTLAQAALGWLWAVSDRTIPIPGFKTAAQIEENAGALSLGPLTSEQLVEIDNLLAT